MLFLSGVARGGRWGGPPRAALFGGRQNEKQKIEKDTKKGHQKIGG